jgi:hypothetical protein
MRPPEMSFADRGGAPLGSEWLKGHNGARCAYVPGTGVPSFDDGLWAPRWPLSRRVGIVTAGDEAHGPCAGRFPK